MPEAAEVEIVRQGLQPLVGQTLKNISADQRLQLPDDIDNMLSGRVLQAVRRRGKLLAFDFGPEYFLTSHLRMTGQWRIIPNSASRDTPNGWRATLEFQHQRAVFSDRRRFATMTIADQQSWAAALGPDLLQLPADWLLAAKHRDRRRALKATLLDQSLVAGIGNYLADESLWANNLHPATPGDSIDNHQWVALYQSAARLAQQALAAGGTTFRDFNSTAGQPGQGQALLMVYGQAGQPCARCQATLQKTKVAGRGSTYCPQCQPERSVQSKSPGH